MDDLSEVSSEDATRSAPEPRKKDSVSNRRFWLTIADGALLFAGVAIGLLYLARPGGWLSVRVPTCNQTLSESLDRLDAAGIAGDPKEFLAAREQVSERLVQWIDHMSARADLGAAFSVGDEDVCAGCQLLPRATKVLSEPVPANVLARMTQLDKDRLDLKQIPWSVVNALAPAFNGLCDRYVDPLTGRMRLAKPD